MIGAITRASAGLGLLLCLAGPAGAFCWKNTLPCEVDELRDDLGAAQMEADTARMEAQTARDEAASERFLMQMQMDEVEARMRALETDAVARRAYPDSADDPLHDLIVRSTVAPLILPPAPLPGAGFFPGYAQERAPLLPEETYSPNR